MLAREANGEHREADMAKRAINLWIVAAALVTLQAAAALFAPPALAGSRRMVATEPVAPASDLSARHIAATLFQLQTGERADFADRDLTYLDLSGLDFKSANLARSDFYGTDFTGSNLKGVDLSRTRLDRAVLIRANLSGANLTDATILRPTVYSTDKVPLTDAPNFAGADMTRISVQAQLSGADFRGAVLSEADFSPLEARPGQGTLVTQPSNILTSCDFSGAKLTNANMTRAFLTFSRFNGADLRGVKFVDADLTKTDFSGADVTGADFTGADLSDANFTGVHGLAQAKGLDKALNFDKLIRQ